MATESSPHDVQAFLSGRAITLDELHALRKACEGRHEVHRCQQLLMHARRHPQQVHGLAQASRKERDKLFIREAVFTSKDPELSAAVRHDQALALLSDRFGNLDDGDLRDAEVLGVAGGICKRRWQDLGRLDDLLRAAAFYRRGADQGLADDAYCHVNAAFLERLLAVHADAPERRLAAATALWQRVIDDLPATRDVEPNVRWWNAVSRAEAHLGLRQPELATQAVLEGLQHAPAEWERESTVRQMSHLAHLLYPQPMDEPAVRALFDALVPGDVGVTLSASMGRVGLALSGGGFRASFYHLGVLARLAELDALRHVSVLSCVSGGSIVGACYWMMLRGLLAQKATLERQDYLGLVQDLIRHFCAAVDQNVRQQIQPDTLHILKNVLRKDQRGALQPELAATALTRLFYAPLARRQRGISDDVYLHELQFQPAGFVPRSADDRFMPSRDNWLRRDKVPELIINATTLNTGHAWQFTPAWMGESPWAVDEAADAIPRLEWAYHEPDAGWRFTLGRAVAASAAVPGVFAPLALGVGYQGGVDVHLADGGVHDNQGTVALLATNCNILMVSDACGQLLFEAAAPAGLAGLPAFAKRAMDMLMERVRLANHGHLQARRQTGLLRGLMFLHMKAGLDADTCLRIGSQASQTLLRQPLSSHGVRKDLQQALAELRTDLDDFTEHEQLALMALGYEMGRGALARDLADVPGLLSDPVGPTGGWAFDRMRQDLTSTSGPDLKRDALLHDLRQGAKTSIAA